MNERENQWLKLDHGRDVQFRDSAGTSKLKAWRGVRWITGAEFDKAVGRKGFRQKTP